MTILISGATGFLGSHLVKGLLEDHKIIALKRSASDTYRIRSVLNDIVSYDIDKVSLEEVFGNQQIDIVINTVTDYGRKESRISSILETNLMFSIRLLEQSIDHGIGTFINTDTLLESNINPYALSKNQFVQWMRFLCQKIQTVNIRIEHMYGPLDDENKFIFWIIGQLEKNVERIDLTSGVQKRDFIYIDDIVKAYNTIIQNLSKLSSFEEFELCTGEPMEVKSFLQHILKQFRTKKSTLTELNFGAVPYRENENMCMQADITKLQRLGWYPSITPQDGIKKIIEGDRNV